MESAGEEIKEDIDSLMVIAAAGLATCPMYAGSNSKFTIKALSDNK